MTSIFDTAAFNERLFFPHPDDTPPPPGARDVSVPVDGAVLRMRCHEHAAARATVVLFYGNGETAATYDALATRYRDELGAQLLVVDYRGYGLSSGEPTYRRAIADAVRVVEALREVSGGAEGTAARGVGHLDDLHDVTVRGPLLVLGRSLGGACAAELAGKVPPLVDGVIMESSGADLLGLIARRGLQPPDALSPKDAADFAPGPKLERCQVPVLFLHGGEDTIISSREAVENHARTGSHDKQLVVVPGHGHNDVMRAPSYWRALRDFVVRVAAQ